MIEKFPELNDRFRPDSFEHITPRYPFNDTYLQFIVLENKGYPVQIQDIDSSEIPDDVYPDDEYFQSNKQRYKYWVRPVVTNPDFAGLIEDPNDPGGIIRLGNEYDELLQGHPVQLVSKVDIGEADSLANDLYHFRTEGKIRFIVSHSEGILTEDLLEKCFLKAFERNLEALSELPFNEHRIPEDYTVELYKELKARGQINVNPAALMELIHDYYSLVEKLSPEFAAFRK
jgi:hypothetical protein